MLRVIDDLLNRALFHHLAMIEHDNMVGDLRHDRQIMGDVDRRGPLFRDDLLEGFQNLDLRGDIKCRGRLIQDKKAWFFDQGHRRH